MKTYRVYYSEHTVHSKKFKANSEKEAMDKAWEELGDSCWDTSEWRTENGEGGQLDVEELSNG